MSLLFFHTYHVAVFPCRLLQDSSYSEWMGEVEVAGPVRSLRVAAWVINVLFLAKSGRINLLPILLLPPLFGGYWWNAMEFGKPINLPFGDGFMPTIYHPFMVISGMICY